MKRRLSLRPEVVADLDQARQWWAENAPWLIEDFEQEFRATIQRVLARPAAYAKVHGQLRHARLRRFKWHVGFFTLADEIVVVGLAHPARHPRFWRRRRA